MNFADVCSKTPLCRYFLIFFSLGFTPCKAKQPLQGMELQEKEAQKDYRKYRKSLSKEPTVNRCLLILNLKPFRL